jgi:glycosyltransferase involved in cell wall biosynthesis
MSFVTVCITYFNERELLTQCLESLAAQSLPPDEILIYDDASEHPPQSFVPKGLTVRIIRGEENRGPAHGRNVLLEASRSDYVHFHDADDWFDPDWCRRVRQAAEQQQNVDVVFTELSSYREGRLQAVKVIGLQRLLNDPDLLAFAVDAVLLTPCGTYRKAFVACAGGYSTRYWQSEDYEFHIRLAAAQPSFIVIPEPLVGQRLHDSCRSKDQAACLRDLVKSLDTFSRGLPARYRDRICQRLAGAACTLFRLGDRTSAAGALALARSLGKPSFRDERFVFRVLAGTLGPEFAIRLGNVYRTVLPQAARRWVARQGV